MKVEETAAAVKEVGAQNFILATDLGQTGNPSPADGLQLFVTDLMKAGLSKDQITTMGREVTGKLLWADSWPCWRVRAHLQLREKALGIDVPTTLLARRGRPYLQGRRGAGGDAMDVDDAI